VSRFQSASNLTRRLAVGLLCGLAGSACLAQPTPAASTDAPNFSAAERVLFMTRHLDGLPLPTTLRYTFQKSGTLEEGFEDKAVLRVVARADGKCCGASTEFLSGSRRLTMPDIDGAEGNPVVLYFLEREVREMQRLTKGAQNYFRKRIRMAIFNTGTVREVALSYAGKTVRGKEIVITPFTDDPNRPRYEKLALKEYRFWLSEQVPGGVFGIRGRIAGEAVGTAPLLVETVFIEGARPPDAEPPR